MQRDNVILKRILGELGNPGNARLFKCTVLVLGLGLGSLGPNRAMGQPAAQASPAQPDQRQQQQEYQGEQQPQGAQSQGQLSPARSDQSQTTQQDQQQNQQQSAEPDNTKRNAAEQLTAEDQGGSETDREITKLIRRELVKNDSLSSTAKNVKIITVDGKVTLRGPVSSEQEKEMIATIAEKIAGKGKVTDQVETKKR